MRRQISPTQEFLDEQLLILSSQPKQYGFNIKYPLSNSNKLMLIGCLYFFSLLQNFLFIKSHDHYRI